MNSKKKNILFLTHYFPPEVNAPANRTYEHCKIWAKEKDIDITVLTNFPNHPDGKLFKGYKNRLIQHETVDGIKVIRLLTFVTANEGFVLRTFNYIFYLVVAFIYAFFEGKKYDLIIATSPQFFCGIAGALIAKLKRKPFILELRDLWPDSIVAVGALKNKQIIALLEKIELWLYNSAERIISVTESFKEVLISKGIDALKISIIYNGVDISSFNVGCKLSNSELEEFLRNNRCVGYIGTLGMAHGLDTVIATAELLTGKNISIIILGSGAEKERLEESIRSKKLSNMKIFPMVPRNEAAEVINMLELFLVHLKKDDLFKTVIPSKIFEGMAMKKAILLGVDGEARKIIENGECGIYFEPENAYDLAEKIIQLIDNVEEKKRLGENGYKCLTINYNREVLAEKMLGIITGALK